MKSNLVRRLKPDNWCIDDSGTAAIAETTVIRILNPMGVLQYYVLVIRAYPLRLDGGGGIV